MSPTPDQSVKIMFLPGNGCSPVRKSNWYGWLASKLQEKFPDAKVICEDFPDPYKAREAFWVPFVKEQIGEPQRETSNPDHDKEEKSSRVFVIGHSSGTVCIMRLLETYKARHALILR